LIATAALPALPGVSTVDEWLRTQLQDFASIPGKARMVAREVLAVLKTPEPPAIEDRSSLDDIVAAIRAHRARFDELQRGWLNLQREGNQRALRHYSKFFQANQKIMEGFKRDFSAEPDSWKAIDSARYIEQKYRDTLLNAAKFLVCAMFEAENTELRVRERLQARGFQIQSGGLNFRSVHIVLSLAAVAVVTIIGCHLAAVFYYLVERFVLANSTLGFFAILSQGTGTFFAWTISTVLLYTLPITLAAGAASYLLDRIAAGDRLTSADYATGAVLTFAGSSILSLFILMAYGLLGGLFKGNDPMPIYELAAWVIPPALVATTYLWLSLNPENLKLERHETWRYVLWHAGAAFVGSLIAYALWRAVGGHPRAETSGNLPDGLTIYLVLVGPICIGMAIGWVLSGTNQPQQGRLGTS
jgi:hypothetical protein